MLAKCLIGSFDDDSLDRDLLCNTMHELAPDFARYLSGLDYGDAGLMQGQFWETLAGYEFVVGYHWNVPGANEAVLSMFTSDVLMTSPKGLTVSADLHL